MGSQLLRRPAKALGPLTCMEAVVESVGTSCPRIVLHHLPQRGQGPFDDGPVVKKEKDHYVYLNTKHLFTAQ
jgi:hypothetical protein